MELLYFTIQHRMREILLYQPHLRGVDFIGIQSATIGYKHGEKLWLKLSRLLIFSIITAAGSGISSDYGTWSVQNRFSAKGPQQFEEKKSSLARPLRRPNHVWIYYYCFPLDLCFERKANHRLGENKYNVNRLSLASRATTFGLRKTLIAPMYKISFSFSTRSTLNSISEMDKPHPLPKCTNGRSEWSYHI